MRTQRNIWQTLPEETRQHLLAAGELRRYAKGAVLFPESEDVQELYILLEGYACLYRSSFRGENRVIFLCADGEILNEMAADSPRMAVAARAVSDVTLLCLPRAAVLARMAGDPELTMALYRSLAGKTRRLYHKVGNDNGTYPLKPRLAAMLWKLARDYGEPAPAGLQIGFEVTVNLLSEMVGAKRESVSRALSELKRSGVISHESGSLTVADMDRLHSIVKEP